MTRKNTTHLSGFTLIELLVVIAIIGILSAVVLTNLEGVRENARNSVMKQQARSVATTLELERIENERFLNYDGIVVGNDPSYQVSCADRTWLGSRAQELESLCNKIVDQALYVDVEVFAIAVAPAYQDGNHFSVMVKLNGGDWYCVGSNGGTYEGPDDPGTGFMTGDGCFFNP